MSSDKEIDIEDIGAGITIFMKDGEMFIDMHLPDYKSETLKDFANVVASLSSATMQLEIITMIQNSFEEQGKKSECDEVLLHIASIAIKENDLLEKLTTKREDEPCIKPSDML